MPSLSKYFFDIFVGLNNKYRDNKKIVLVAQKNPEVDNPSAEDLYSYGCESKILQLLKLPDGTVKVLVEGLDRVKKMECKNDKEFNLKFPFILWLIILKKKYNFLRYTFFS